LLRTKNNVLWHLSIRIATESNDRDIFKRAACKMHLTADRLVGLKQPGSQLVNTRWLARWNGMKNPWSSRLLCYK
jgi:hypothetical protein